MWISVHVSFDGDHHSRTGDDILTRIVAPIVRLQSATKIHSYFVVRYVDERPHIRLRLRAHHAAGTASIRHAVDKRLTEYANQETWRRISLSHSWREYEPEVHRYGGKVGVSLAEDLFFASSEFAIALLEKRALEPRARRIAQALAPLIILLHAIAKERTRASRLALAMSQEYMKVLSAHGQNISSATNTEFVRRLAHQRDRVQPTIETLWSMLSRGDKQGVVYRSYYDAAVRTRMRIEESVKKQQLRFYDTVSSSSEEAVAFLLPSYIHMMNNRLGLQRIEEAYLEFLIGSLLSPHAVAAVEP